MLICIWVNFIETEQLSWSGDLFRLTDSSEMGCGQDALKYLTWIYTTLSYDPLKHMAGIYMLMAKFCLKTF